jgi:1-deoxy-D-xylulose-5-phosphate synthase
MLLDTVHTPADLRRLNYAQLDQLAVEVRDFIVNAVAVTGGHLGSNLGVVELTFALHRVFDSPKDYLLWDTGHQAYVHKIVTGRAAEFTNLRQPGGLSGYPSAKESEHDIIENSHASTVLSYAHGIANSLVATKQQDRRVVAVIGDGSMTGGMAYEALNNLGHSNSRVLIVLNDNGRSYAPTISGLTRTVSKIRTMPSYARGKKKSESIINNLPLVGDLSRRTIKGVKAALREVVDEPHAFFETLGVRYVGPVDGHNVAELEKALADAAGYEGAIVLHVLTQKGKGYSFAEDDVEKNLHDVPPLFDPLTGAVTPAPENAPTKTWTNQFTETVLSIARENTNMHAITAAMPGPTGLLSFEAEHPDRFHDTGIAEQHAVTMAAGMAMGGLQPIVALYSTFLTRAIDQATYDVGMHQQAVVFALDRAGITGDDGPSHHGVLDMVLLSKVPGITMFAPSSAQELDVQLRTAMTIKNGPSSVRYARGVARQVDSTQVGSGLNARKVLDPSTAQTPAQTENTDADANKSNVCILAVGRLLEAAEGAAAMLRSEGIPTTVWDPRCVKPLDPQMIADAARHALVVTVEDGLRDGGIGSYMADAITEARLASHSTAGPIVIIGVPNRFIPQGKPARILSDLGLDAAGIYATVIKSRESMSVH